MIFAPDDFKGRPYGYLTNQISHIYLGVFLATFYCWLLDKVSTYPNQTIAFAVVAGVYFIWWEVLNQGWRSFDTIEDTFYVTAGASTYLFIDMQWVIDRVFLSFVILFIPLGIGTVFRWYQVDE